MGRFKSRYHLFTRNTGERIQEFVEAVIARQVVNQISEGHTSTDETGVPPRMSGSLWTTDKALGMQPLDRFYSGPGLRPQHDSPDSQATPPPTAQRRGRGRSVPHPFARRLLEGWPPTC